MSIYIISDLHLCESRPESMTLFKSFMKERIITGGNTLYILGDFFEYWIGDDIYDAFQLEVMMLLKQARQAGCPLFFMHGNRDFFIGKQFSKMTGCKLLGDPYTIEVYGTKICLMHGDLLCTDDTSYQWFRKFVRNSLIQKLFLSFPTSIRQKIAKNIRQKSQNKKRASTSYVDVTEKGIQKYASHVDTLIHGHTHRLNIHQHGDLRRIVLGDWHDTGSYVHIDEGEISLYCFYPVEQIGSSFYF
jgi:UDP-2,3-diacylglucosamine hydrolase